MWTLINLFIHSTSNTIIQNIKTRNIILYLKNNEQICPVRHNMSYGTCPPLLPRTVFSQMCPVRHIFSISSHVSRTTQCPVRHI